MQDKRLHKDIMKVLVYLEWFKETLKANAMEGGIEYEEALQELKDKNGDASSAFDRSCNKFVIAMEKYLDMYPHYKESSNYRPIYNAFAMRMDKVLRKTEDYLEVEFYPLVFLMGVGRWNDWSRVRGFDELKEIDYGEVVKESRKEGCNNQIYMQALGQLFKGYWEY